MFGSINKEFNGSCPTNSLMAKTEDLRFIKCFDEKFRRLEDTDLNIRAALNGFHFIGIKKYYLINIYTKKIIKIFHQKYFIIICYMKNIST